MTLLVSWAGVDTHGTSSAYIASDSRVTWDGLGTFDHGRKVYALQSSPDILGYCGDVLFPSIVLSQIVDMANQGLLFAAGANSKDRFEAIKEKLVQQFHRYPNMIPAIAADTLQVFHISRSFDGREFAGWRVDWHRAQGWSVQEMQFPSSSGVMFALGSGAQEFRANMARYATGKNSDTSRNVFHCFCDALANTQVAGVGGAPQLVGIYRKPGSVAMPYGIITGKQRFFAGALVERGKPLDVVEWRNDLFELCDGDTMQRRPEAQPQPDPLRRR